MNSIVNDHIIALKKTIHLINKKMLLFNTEQKIQVISTFIERCIIFGKPINYEVTNIVAIPPTCFNRGRNCNNFFINFFNIF